MRKPDFYICENKEADQLRSFRHIDSTMPLLPKSEISSLEPSSVAVQPCVCRTWSETPKTGFLMTQLKYICLSVFKINFLLFYKFTLLQIYIVLKSDLLRTNEPCVCS